MSYTLDLEAVSRVSWYPGHMLKAQREIGDKLKLIDVVVIVVDARLPYSSWNRQVAPTMPRTEAVLILRSKMYWT